MFQILNKSDKFHALMELGVCVFLARRTTALSFLAGLSVVRTHLLSKPSCCPMIPRVHICSCVMVSGSSSHSFCDPQNSAQSQPSKHTILLSPPLPSQSPHSVLTMLVVVCFPRLPLCRQKGFLPATPSQQECDLGPIPPSGL